MARRMRDPEFQNDQWQHRFADHVAPVNLLVDELRREVWVPYIAPMYGGIYARLLYLMQDPGKMTQDDDGSGFLSWENNDPTAEKLCNLFAKVGIKASEVVPWNAYPWYINRKPKATELEKGVEPLKRLIDLLPNLKVVMLLGRSAKDGWQRLGCRFPSITYGLKVIETYHTSPRAYLSKNPAVPEQRRAEQYRAFLDAARRLSETSLS